MKSKWSKVSWAMQEQTGVQEFQMVELVSKEGRSQEQKEKKKEKVLKHDCSELQRQAYEQGRQKGIEEGLAQNQAEIDHAMQQAIKLGNEVGRARMMALEEQERDIVEVALVISRKIILRELEIDKELIVRQVRHILGQLVNTGLVTLKVHPQDFAVLEPLHKTLQSEFVDGAHLVIEPHEEIQIGGCLVEQAGLQLDARLSQQLETVAAEFGLETSSL